MVDAKNISEYSTTAASNLALNGISDAEGWLPSTVNNFTREWLSQLAKFYDDFGGVNTVAGTGDAITITTPTTYTAYATGIRLRFKASAVNTGAVTLNLDAIGAKAVRKIIGGTDVALAAGDIMDSRSYDLVYSTAANAAAGGFIIQPSKVAIPDGTVSLPGAYFDADTDTGLYRIGANNVGVAANGAKVLDIGTTATEITGKLKLNDASFSLSSNSLQFTGDANTGITYFGADVYYLVAGGNIIALVSSGAFDINQPASVAGLLDLSLTGGGQIKFPASQNASAGANTLDDYEEGTFTITAVFGTVGSSTWAYTIQTGTYTKVGNAVFLSYDFSGTPTIGTGSGTVTLNGNPFTSAINAVLIAGQFGATWTWPASTTSLNGSITSSATGLTIRSSGSATAVATFAASNMTSASAHTARFGGTILV